MLSSRAIQQSALATATASAGLDVEPLVPNLHSISVASNVQPLVEAVWPDTDDALSRLRRAIASWLASAPYPMIGPCHAPLSCATHFLRLEPSLSSMQIASAAPSHVLRVILLSQECHGGFTIGLLEGQTIVMLDELALRRAAAQTRAARNNHQRSVCLVSPWDAGVTTLAVGHAGFNRSDNFLSSTCNHESGRSLTAIAPTFLSSSSSDLLAALNGTPSRALSVGLDGSCEQSELLHAAAAAADTLLPQPVLAAIAAAWPGNSALARLKRRAALSLAAAQDGPEGPYSMLASALGDVLHRHEPDAVAELRHPVTKTLRVKQLLHEGGPNEAVNVAASMGLQPASTHLLVAPVPTAGGVSVDTGAAAAGGLSSGGSLGFLRVVKGKYDIVVVLDFLALMQTHGQGAPSAVGGGPVGSRGASATLLSSPPVLQPARSFGGASTTSNGSVQLGGSVSQPSPTLLLNAAVSGVSVGSEGAAIRGGPVNGGSLQWTVPGSQNMAPAPPLFVVAPPPAATAAGPSALPYGTEGVTELALRAFPGSAPAAQLRRAIVVHLAGLPRRSQQWTHLGTFVASSQAQLWLNPAYRWPKLKAFVSHPDSRGVFLDVQVPPGAPSASGHPFAGLAAAAAAPTAAVAVAGWGRTASTGSVGIVAGAGGLVALDPTALRRAAATGLTAAITAAWSGNSPLERIRRAAAFTLAFAVRGPAGPYTMLGSALGTAIRKRDKEAFDALAGMGKLSELLDDTTSSGAAAAAAALSNSSSSSLSGAATARATAAALLAAATAALPPAQLASSAAGLAAAAAAFGSTGGGGLGANGASGGVPGGDDALAAGGCGNPREDAAVSGPSGAGGDGGGDGAVPEASRRAGRAVEGGGRDGGAGGAGSGGGYIESFKKDQDGYMRLRLEALLQDFPHNDGSAVTAGLATPGRLPTRASSCDGCPSAAGRSSTGPSADLPTSSVSASGGAALQPPAAPPLLPSVASAPSQLALSPPASAAFAIPTLMPSLPAVAGSSAACSASACAILPPAAADPSSRPLEQELLRRFPVPPGAAAGGEAATVGAAKRCIARLLAWAPPPHQLTFAKLGAQVPKLLGGARIGRNLRLVCLEEPDVFAVQSQSSTVHVVRLVCPRLLHLAHEQTERRSALNIGTTPATTTTTTTTMTAAMINPSSACTTAPVSAGPSSSSSVTGGAAAGGAVARALSPAPLHVNPVTLPTSVRGPGPSLQQSPGFSQASGYLLQPQQQQQLQMQPLPQFDNNGIVQRQAPYDRMSQQQQQQQQPQQQQQQSQSTHGIGAQLQQLQLQQQQQPSLQHLQGSTASRAAAATAAILSHHALSLPHSHHPQDFAASGNPFLSLPPPPGAPSVAAGNLRDNPAVVSTAQQLQQPHAAPGDGGEGEVQRRLHSLFQQQQQQARVHFMEGTATCDVTVAGPAATQAGGWSGVWQQQLQHASSEQHRLFLPQDQQQHQQEAAAAPPPLLRPHLSTGAVTGGGSMGDAVQQGLYDHLMLTSSAPLATVISSPGPSVFSSAGGGGRFLPDSGPSSASETTAGSLWQAPADAAANSNTISSSSSNNSDNRSALKTVNSLSVQQAYPHSQAERRPHQLTSAGSTLAPLKQDFAASALVAEQALQSVQHVAASATVGGGGCSGGSATAGLLPTTAVHVLSDPYSSDFLAVLQHCHACAQIGIAVQVYDGRPALVSLYAPSAVVLAGPHAGAATAGLGLGQALGGETWTPAVYVLECTASSAGEGPGALVNTLLDRLRGLLEDPGVAKVVHGCEQVRSLEIAAGASVAPLLDTRVLLEAVTTLLPPLPPPPAPAAVAAAVASAASAGSALPAGGYSSAEAAAVAQLAAHVGGLRAVLTSVELWSDRPEMVAALGALHFAAHRVKLWAVAGRDSTWLSRPLTESQVAVAAQGVHHLPELWAALCEAVPWLAAHAALRLMQALRSAPLPLSVPTSLHVGAGGGGGAGLSACSPVGQWQTGRGGMQV